MNISRSGQRLESELRKHPRWIAVLASLPREAGNHVRFEEVAADVRGCHGLACTDAEVIKTAFELQSLGLEVACSPSRGYLHWRWRPWEYAIVEKLFVELPALIALAGISRE